MPFHGIELLRGARDYDATLALLLLAVHVERERKLSHLRKEVQRLRRVSQLASAESGVVGDDIGLQRSKP